MGLFRNREIRRFSLIWLGICLLFTATGLLCGWTGWFLVPMAGLLLYGLWLWDTHRRYKIIAGLAGEIDSILHSREVSSLSQYREGELSLLENEISKLLIKLREQNDQLEKDRRYLADSMADISHQLRTRLTTIHLTLSSMGEEGLSPEKQTAYRREISRELGRMDWLVSSLLKLSKLDAGTIQFRPVSITLADLVRQAAEPLVIPMELKGQTFRSETSGTVSCDPAWTGEALTNILKNCMEHMEGGTLTVTAQENALYSQIIIRDTGPGIDPEDLPNLFKRFYRGKNAGPESVGIGLALSRAILTAQNATVKARNHPQGGAEFTVRFYKGTV